MKTNRHPVDRLAEVRAEIKLLSEEEARLRAELLAENADLSGSEFYARITSQTQSRVDRKLLEERFGAAAVAECCKAVVVARVVLVEREPDEAAA